ncbi:hypothetical protein E2C01_054858 [Portunus trituberculatus]|uniref:Uncharacterized protein n=1 Tax=Portunus trituberculatus TaxID=210409 RepID=A0A5B7GKX9_PORTR|nr:hypothetical protein [Portunus trituberculatus]
MNPPAINLAVRSSNGAKQEAKFVNTVAATLWPHYGDSARSSPWVQQVNCQALGHWRDKTSLSCPLVLLQGNRGQGKGVREGSCRTKSVLVVETPVDAVRGLRRGEGSTAAHQFTAHHLSISQSALPLSSLSCSRLVSR